MIRRGAGKSSARARAGVGPGPGRRPCQVAHRSGRRMLAFIAGRAGRPCPAAAAAAAAAASQLQHRVAACTYYAMDRRSIAGEEASPSVFLNNKCTRWCARAGRPAAALMRICCAQVGDARGNMTRRGVRLRSIAPLPAADLLHASTLALRWGSRATTTPGAAAPH
jgi:hypothetical protein